VTAIATYRSALLAYNRVRADVDAAYVWLQQAQERHRVAAGIATEAHDKLKAARAEWEREVMAGEVMR
jgi:hypothetical protein